jgi:hypothetical protein
VQIDLEPLAGETLATARVEMNGTRHFDVLNELAGKVGDDLFDDRGAADAIERLGKPGRMFGRKEIRHLQHLLRGNERVMTIGQRRYGDRQGLVVLTTVRLFFFEKSLGSETIEEFSLTAITSLAAKKVRFGGEHLVIHAAGSSSEMTHLFPGHADEVARQFRRLRGEAVERTASVDVAPPEAATGSDHLTTLKSLADLRDQGILTAEEFEQKKADILDRL